MNRNLTADGVRNLLVTDFRNHSSAGDGLLDHLWNPLAAANCSAWALNANLLAAAGIAWVTDALFDDWTWDAVSLCDPFATANVDRLALSDWFANCVANVFVASFGFGFP